MFVAETMEEGRLGKKYMARVQGGKDMRIKKDNIEQLYVAALVSYVCILTARTDNMKPFIGLETHPSNSQRTPSTTARSLGEDIRLIAKYTS